MVYVDGGIFLGKDDDQLKAVIHKIQDTGLNIEDQGHLANYVGETIKKLRDGSYEFTQRALIDAIIADVNLTDAKVKPVPAKVSLPSRMHHLSILTSTIVLLLASSTISLRPPEATSCMQLIRLPSTLLTQGNLMEKPFFTWYAI